MEKSGFQCLLLGSVAKKQPRAEKVCKVRLDWTISKMSLTYRHLVWKAIRFKVPEYVDCTGSPRAERSTEIVTELRSLPKMFFMSQHPLIQKLMNGIKQTSLGNRIVKPPPDHHWHRSKRWNHQLFQNDHISFSKTEEYWVGLDPAATFVCIWSPRLG